MRTEKLRPPLRASCRGGKRSGSRLGDASALITRPTSAIGSAIRVSSNIVKGSYPSVSRRPDTTMLVEVPMSVVIPPRIAANDSGMR